MSRQQEQMTQQNTYLVYTYNNDKLVAGGQSGTILASDNGINWITQTITTTQLLKNVTYNSNRYITVG